ncbi:MAG: hypothetical protein ABIS14_12380 [Sphingomonas sp.]
MLAYAWKSFGWFLAGVAVALGFLLVPLQVASERKKLDRTVSEIAAAKRDIRALETEFDTRANLAQLEQWNGDTLRLTAPVAGQFVSDEAALASIDLRSPPAGEPGVQMASLVVPSQPTGTATVQAIQPAVHLVPVSTGLASVPSAEPGLAAVLTDIRTAAVSRGHAATTERGTGQVIKDQVIRGQAIRGQAVALLDRKLLSDSTMGDLMTSARAEAHGAGR